MVLKLNILLSLLLSTFMLRSQENNEEGFRKTFRSELKVVESKLARKPNDVNLNYKYGLLCYKLCKYREAQKALYKCMNDYKDNPFYFLDLYHIEIALRNKVQAEDFFYKYHALNKKLGLESNYVLKYQELTSVVKPSLTTKDQKSKDYFPFVLNNGKIKYLTQSDFSYTEPTSPLLNRNYLTNEVVFIDSAFQNPKLLQQPSKTSDGFSFHAFCLNKAHDKIYMTRYDGNNKRMIICVSNKEGLRWQPFRTITYVTKNPKFNFMHPMLSENENQLIFASDLKGGHGGYDLWIADLNENGDFSKVRNLGDNVNSLGNELFPTMYDGNTFFFSSDGHPGYGSLDLYRCDISDNKFSNPINLGSSFNSARDEYSLFYSKDKETGYFTSNRSVGNANLFIDKIYKIKLNVFNCEILDLEIRNPFSKNELVSDANEPSNGDLSKSLDQNKESLASTTIETLNQANETRNNSENIESSQSNSVMESNGQENSYDYNPSEVQKIIDASKVLLKNDEPPSTNSSNTAKEQITLYDIKNDKIEEKFVQFSDNASITNLKTEVVVENKFWAAAKLWFKDFNLAIGYTYVRVINPKNEVIYSNYSSENGMISVEVVETNEYTIEIPRFKTMLKGVVFKDGENNFYFPYESNKKNTTNAVSVNRTNDTKPLIKKTKKITKQKKPKLNPTNLGLAITKVNPASPKPRAQTPKQNTTKKSPEKKNAPRNMIENFN